MLALGLGAVLVSTGCAGTIAAPPSQPSANPIPSSTSIPSPTPRETPATPSPLAALDLAPIAVAIGPDGSLYASDCDAARVYRMVGQAWIVVAGSGPGGLAAGFSGDGGPAVEAQLACPVGLAFDRQGNLYVADHLNNRVRRIDTRGVITTVVGHGAGFGGDGGPATAALLKGPFGITIDSFGNLYVADRDNNRIRKVDNRGTITTSAGNGEADYSGDGSAATEAALNRPIGVAADDAGNLYIADENNNRVRLVDGNGVITTLAGTGDHASSGDGGPATAAALADTQDVVLDGAGGVIASESEGHRVRRIDADGFISAFAGTGVAGYSGDGAAAVDAQLIDPGYMAIDLSGRVYVVDRGNRCIRVIDRDSLISSLWCSGG